MTTLTIKIPDSERSAVYNLLKKTGGEIIMEKLMTKEEQAAEFKEGLHQALDILEGKRKRQTLKDALGA